MARQIFLSNHLPRWGGSKKMAAVPLDPVSDLSADSFFSPDYVSLRWVNPGPDVISKNEQDYPVNTFKSVRIYRDDEFIYEGSENYFNDIDVEQENEYTYKVVAISSDGVESNPAEIRVLYRQKFTCTFYNDNGSVKQVVEVYNGDYVQAPAGSSVTNGTFKAWVPDVTVPIKSDMSFYPSFTWNLTHLQQENISDSWPQIIANMDADNYDQYARKYKVLILDQPYLMQCGGRLKDTITGTSEKAKMTWISRTVSDYTTKSGVTTTSATVKHYSATPINSRMESLYESYAPSYLKSRIVQVDKKHKYNEGQGNIDEVTPHYIWALGIMETYASPWGANTSIVYTDIFSQGTSSVYESMKNSTKNGTAANYWFRDISWNGSTVALYLTADGKYTQDKGTLSCGITPGFCLN